MRFYLRSVQDRARCQPHALQRRFANASVYSSSQKKKSEQPTALCAGASHACGPHWTDARWPCDQKDSKHKTPEKARLDTQMGTRILDTVQASDQVWTEPESDEGQAASWEGTTWGNQPKERARVSRQKH